MTTPEPSSPVQDDEALLRQALEAEERASALWRAVPDGVGDEELLRQSLEELSAAYIIKPRASLDGLMAALRARLSQPKEARSLASSCELVGCAVLSRHRHGTPDPDALAAARYRWLRREDNEVCVVIGDGVPHTDELDRVIDAAMLPTPPQEG